MRHSDLKVPENLLIQTKEVNTKLLLINEELNRVNLDFETRVEEIDGELEGVAEAVFDLDTRVTINEGNIVAQANALIALDVQVVDNTNNILGNSSAIFSLDTRVTTNEGGITANASAITALEVRVTDTETDTTANASAITSLDVRVTVNEGDITAQASSITQLQTDVAGNTASITTNSTAISNNSSAIATNTTSITANTASINTEAIARATADGFLEGKYTLTAIAGDVVTGLNITSASGGGTNISEFTIQADRFKIYNGSTGEIPFKVDGGNVYIDNGFIRNLTADNITANTITANEIQVGSITGGTGGSLASTTVDTDNIVNDAISTMSSNTATNLLVSSGNTYNVVSTSASNDSSRKALITVQFIYTDGAGTGTPKLAIGIYGNNSGYIYQTINQPNGFQNGITQYSCQAVASSVSDSQYRLDVAIITANGTAFITDALITVTEFKK